MALRACIKRSALLTRLGACSVGVEPCLSRWLPVEARVSRCVAPLLEPSAFASRSYTTVQEAQNQLDAVNDLFVDARDLIEDARDEAETVYFNEAHQEAKDAVQKVLDKYNGVMHGLSDSEKGKLQRAMGLKIEQLKAELGNLDLLHA